MKEQDLSDILKWVARGLLIFSRPQPTLQQAAIRAAMSLRSDIGQVPGLTVEALAKDTLYRLRHCEDTRKLMAERQRRRKR